MIILLLIVCGMWYGKLGASLAVPISCLHLAIERTITRICKFKEAHYFKEACLLI